MEGTPDNIRDFFAGREILVTGGTGFMGKVLIEKFLRSVPEIGKIYILIRPKKGKDPQLRLKEMFYSTVELFRKLLEKYPNCLEKVVAMPADISAPDLGLSTADKTRLIDNVSVVIHMAANVRFDTTLKTAIKTNAGGTKALLEIVKQMKNLKSFVYVSTAYSQTDVEVVEERYYPTPITPESMLRIVDTVDEECLKALTPKLLGAHPNTYSISKAFAEDIVAHCGLPTGVARPSIVSACLKEPTEGWFESLNGPAGLLLGGAKGVMRSLLVSPDNPSNLIPCDIAVNGIIALAWKVAMERPKEPIFMNVVSSPKNSLIWGTFIKSAKNAFQENPITGALWNPGGHITSSMFVFVVNMILFQIIPACILDLCFLVTRRKPFLLKIQQKLITGTGILRNYLVKHWKFRTDQMVQLERDLCPLDRETFFMETVSIDWHNYIIDYALGVRHFYLMEDPSTLPKSQRVQKYYVFADVLVKIVFGLWLVWVLYGWLSTPRIGPSSAIQ